jgi:hypothetical protein
MAPSRHSLPTQTCGVVESGVLLISGDRSAKRVNPHIEVSVPLWEGKPAVTEVLTLGGSSRGIVTPGSSRRTSLN